MTPEELEEFREANRDRLERIRGNVHANISHSLRSRKKRRDERVMVDGHWYHHEAPHGTASGSQYYGCCCMKCRKWNNDNAKATRRRLKKEQAGGLD